jgi:hypothetical protein
LAEVTAEPIFTTREIMITDAFTRVLAVLA